MCRWSMHRCMQTPPHTTPLPLHTLPPFPFTHYPLPLHTLPPFPSTHYPFPSTHYPPSLPHTTPLPLHTLPPLCPLILDTYKSIHHCNLVSIDTYKSTHHCNLVSIDTYKSTHPWAQLVVCITSGIRSKGEIPLLSLFSTVTCAVSFQWWR